MDNINFFELCGKKLEDCKAVIQKIEADKQINRNLESIANRLVNAVITGGAIYLCGNGGSAAEAQHIATEFVVRFYDNRKAINAEALTVNTSSLTAIGNDYDFDRIFVRQLEAKGKAGDILVGMTTSGTSKNVLDAMEYAKSIGMYTVLLTGMNEYEYDNEIYDFVIKVPSNDTPRIQEIHLFIGHLLAEYVESVIMQ